jgi:hypothetical protein
VTRVAGLLVAAALCLGCASTRFYSGKAPAETASGYDARWHSALFLGSVPLHRPYELARICRQGWSEVRMEADAFTVLVTLGTLFIYTPSRLTVVCAAANEGVRPRLLTYPAPGSARARRR